MRITTKNSTTQVVESYIGTAYDTVKAVADRLPYLDSIEPSVAEMKTKKYISGAYVRTQGYYTPGDGGQGIYLIQTTSEFGGTPDGYGDHVIGNGNVAVLQHAGIVNVRQFGAKGDGVTGDGVAMQAALDFSVSTGHSVLFPAGTYLISATLNYTAAVGGGLIGDGIGKSVIKWYSGTAGDVMLRVQSSATVQSKGLDIRGIEFDGSSTATYGLEIKTLWYSFVRDILVKHVTASCYRFHCYNNSEVSGYTSTDVQANTFDNLIATCNSTHSKGFELDGADTAGGNTSLNFFGQLHIWNGNSIGLDLINADGNSFELIRCFDGGTGNSIEFQGDAAGGVKFARHNVIIHCQTTAAQVVARNGSGATASIGNVILYYSENNGGTANAPLIESGAELVWKTPQVQFKGASSNHVVVGGGAGDIERISLAGSQRAAAGDEALRIFHKTTNHVVMANNAGDSSKVYLDAGGSLVLENTNVSGDHNEVIVKGIFQLGSTTGIVASTTQAQGQGALTTSHNVVATVANTNDTVTLPNAEAGRQVTIINAGANTLQIFPASGDNLGAGSNNSTTLAAGAVAIFTGSSFVRWYQAL